MAISEPLCSCCGIMLATPPIDGALCGNCIVKPKEFRIARSAMVYNHQSMAIIHRFKYDGKIQLAAPLGGLLLNTYLRYWPAETIDLILPVPLHIKKFRRRGFNQAYLMISGSKAISGEKAWAGFHERLRTDVLIRNRATVPQTGLGRRQRVKNIKGVFSVRLPDVVKDRRVLVVDDVYTTGSTVNECARTLLDAGAAHVDVLTLARAVQHSIDLKPIG